MCCPKILLTEKEGRKEEKKKKKGEVGGEGIFLHHRRWMAEMGSPTFIWNAKAFLSQVEKKEKGH